MPTHPYTRLPMTYSHNLLKGTAQIRLSYVQCSQAASIFPDSFLRISLAPRELSICVIAFLTFNNINAVTVYTALKFSYFTKEKVFGGLHEMAEQVRDLGVQT